MLEIRNYIEKHNKANKINSLKHDQQEVKVGLMLQEASIHPPVGLVLKQIPQFIFFGFDDNQDVNSMEWILDLLNSKANPSGNGNRKTYDGTKIHASFFCFYHGKG